MKFAITKEHRDFFQKQGWIEFEDFLPSNQLRLVNQAIDQALAERLNIPIEQLHHLSSDVFYLQGRDIWRSNEGLRKFVTQPRFAEIASELIERKPLRLGYDQLFPARYPSTLSPQVHSHSIYSRFIGQTINLEDVSCLRGIICGLMLSLGPEKEGSEEDVRSEEGMDIFPSLPGHAIFFQPTSLINWKNLYLHSGQRFYLIVYTQALAHYYLQPQDPHAHAFKRLGYVLNDKLIDKLNPIVYR